MKGACVVIVFARAPSPGRAKTRLAPGLGEWRAARLHARLTMQALATARRTRYPVELHAMPRPDHAFFRHCAHRFGVRVRPQRGADLGARMHVALSTALRRHRAVVLIGSDCPVLRPADLRRAARLLSGAADVVLAPAEDGGYALIGARKVDKALFRGVTWGGTQVYRDSLENLAALRYRWRALRSVWDVDRPEDVARMHALRHGRRARIS